MKDRFGRHIIAIMAQLLFMLVLILSSLTSVALASGSADAMGAAVSDKRLFIIISVFVLLVLLIVLAIHLTRRTGSDSIVTDISQHSEDVQFFHDGFCSFYGNGGEGKPFVACIGVDTDAFISRFGREAFEGLRSLLVVQLSTYVGSVGWVGVVDPGSYVVLFRAEDNAAAVNCIDSYLWGLNRVMAQTNSLYQRLLFAGICSAEISDDTDAIDLFEQAKAAWNRASVINQRCVFSE